MIARIIYTALVPVVLFGGSRDKDGTDGSNDGMNSVLWCQTSTEYPVACIQTFRAAAEAVKAGLKDPNWSAALEQTVDYEKLPPAVIADVDETLLDNTPYQARLVKSGEKFNPLTWDEWVKEEQADSVPGAKEFISFLKSNGVKIFYVTNRSLEAPTIRNIQKVLDPDATAENVHCKYEREGWGSDKTSRRALIAKTHRILVLIGDDYNDFAYVGHVGPAERTKRATDHRAYWGTKWFILSNPQYGNWERSLTHYDPKLDPSEMLEAKRNHLNTKERTQ